MLHRTERAASEMHAEQKAKRISISPISRDSKRSPEAVKKTPVSGTKCIIKTLLHTDKAIIEFSTISANMHMMWCCDTYYKDY